MSINYNNEAFIRRLAMLIADLIVDVEDVILTTDSQKGLIIPICKALKRKPRRDITLKIQRIWRENIKGVRNQVQELLNKRFNSFERLDSISSIDAPLKQTEDGDGDLPRNVQTVSDSEPQSQFDEIPIVVTPKSRKRVYNTDNETDFNDQVMDHGIDNNYDDNNDCKLDEDNQNLKKKNCNSVIDNNNYENIDNDHDYETSGESFTCAADITSSGTSGNSESEYVVPRQSPSIKKKFSTSLGKIRVSSVQFLDKDGSIDKNKVRLTISKCMLEDLHYACPLSFYGGIRPNLEFLVTYAKCRYASHSQSFRFDVTDFKTPFSWICISATECSEIVHEGPKIHCTLRGECRTEVKNELKHVAPRMIHLQTAEKIDREIAEDGHMQELRRLTTYQKAKSEESCKNDTTLRSNDLSDLFQQHILDGESNDPYIRQTGLPLYAHMYSEEQLNMIEAGDNVVHLDSTGCVVRKPKDVRCKRIMYYAMVINKNSTVIPIAEMVSSEHDVASISTFLKKYRHFLNTKNVTWPMFRVVVVDWSWALINSVMNEWNMKSVTDYLKEAFDCLTNEINLNFNLIVVHSCCAHFQKRVSNNIHKKFPKYLHVKQLVLECVGLMIHCRTMVALDEVFDNFITILLTTSQDQARGCFVKLDELHHLKKSIDDLGELIDDEDRVEIAIDEKTGGAIFADSPFYKHYYARLLRLKSNVITGNNDNEYNAPEVAEYITQSLMPYAPMWSALLLNYVTPNLVRLSNANVECHFNIVKKEVLNGQVNLKIGRFLKKMNDYKKQLCAEAAFTFPLKSLKSRRRGALTSSWRSEESPNNPLVQEMWQRKRNAQYSHLEGRLLGKITKKIKTENIKTSTPKSLCSPNVSFVNHEQSLLNRSDSSTHQNALPNGLFMDVEYYMQVTDHDFTIGIYSPKTCAPIIGFDEFDLFSDQFRTLRKNTWIDGAVIDAFAVTMISDSKEIAYVPTTFTSYLLGDFSDKDKSNEWRMYNLNNDLKGIILMPYLYANHWSLLVVNVDEGTLMHLEPSSKRSANSRRAIENFKQYVRQCANIKPNALTRINWNEVRCTGDRPLQKDAFNCGVYVMYYLKCLFETLDYDLNFQPNHYRIEVATSLLELSNNMKDICQYCFSKKQPVSIMCNTCRRWAHITCLNRMKNVQRTLEEWNDPMIRYRCALCAHGTRQWMHY